MTMAMLSGSNSKTLSGIVFVCIMSHQRHLAGAEEGMLIWIFHLGYLIGFAYHP